MYSLATESLIAATVPPDTPPEIIPPQDPTSETIPAEASTDLDLPTQPFPQR